MNKIMSLSLAATIPLIYAQAANAESLNHPAVAAEQSSESAASKNSSMGPTRFEQVPPDEAGQIEDIVSLTRKLLEKRYGDTLARRAVHPKDHGCVRAHFTVNSDIPEKYRVGVFATPAENLRGMDTFLQRNEHDYPRLRPQKRRE